MWYVNQRVVCVDASSRPGHTPAITQGKVYVVRGILPACCGGGLFLLIDNGCPKGWTQCGSCGYMDTEPTYHERRFRPLDALTEQLERIESEGAPVELEPEYA